MDLLEILKNLSEIFLNWSILKYIERGGKIIKERTKDRGCGAMPKEGVKRGAEGSLP